MGEGFPMVPLGQVVLPVERPEFPDVEKVYRQIGVKLWGEGAYERETIHGSQTKYSTLSLVRANDIIVNKIWARNGSVAVVSDNLDGCYGSGEFPTFTPIQERLYPRWFHWLTKTSSFWEQCDEKSRGTSGKNRIRPEKFLEVMIPLPPLEEQQRIVARIEELAGKIEEARGLRREAVVEAKSIFASAMNSIWRNKADWNTKPTRDLVSIVSGLVDPRDEPYASLPHINGEAMESGTGRLLTYRIAKDEGLISGKFHFKAGTILYSKIRPYLRKAVQVPVEGICSADVYAFENVDPVLEPRFFMYSLIAPAFTEYANDLSGRTRMPKLNQDQLLSFRISYPTIPEQQRIVTYLDDLQSRVASLRRVQAETSAELDALLPSILDKAFTGEL